MGSNTATEKQGVPMLRTGQKVWFVSLAIATLAGALPAYAQPRLDRAAQVLEQQARRGKGEFISFLIGAASAYRWSEGQGTEATFCPPEAPLEGRRYASMALEEYKRGRTEYMKMSGYPLDILTLALLRSLREQFPCVAEKAADSATTE
jgi:hypothetical protein